MRILLSEAHSLDIFPECRQGVGKGQCFGARMGFSRRNKTYTWFSNCWFMTFKSSINFCSWKSLLEWLFQNDTSDSVENGLAIQDSTVLKFLSVYKNLSYIVTFTGVSLIHFGKVGRTNRSVILSNSATAKGSWWIHRRGMFEE